MKKLLFSILIIAAMPLLGTNLTPELEQKFAALKEKYEKKKRTLLADQAIELSDLIRHCEWDILSMDYNIDRVNSQIKCTVNAYGNHSKLDNERSRELARLTVERQQAKTSLEILKKNNPFLAKHRAELAQLESDWACEEKCFLKDARRSMMQGSSN